MSAPIKKLVSSEYPKSHVMNPARTYINAASTDIRATFERIRQEQLKAKEVTHVPRIY